MPIRSTLTGTRAVSHVVIETKGDEGLSEAKYELKTKRLCFFITRFEKDQAR